MKNDIYSSGMCIQKAAGMVRGRSSLDKIKAICDNQKSVSTEKLRALLEAVEEDIRLDGIFLKGVADRMAKLEQRPEFDLSTVHGREQAVIAGLRAKGF